jgi:hypothetical protein
MRACLSGKLSLLDGEDLQDLKDKLGYNVLVAVELTTHPLVEVSDGAIHPEVNFCGIIFISFAGYY